MQYILLVVVMFLMLGFSTFTFYVGYKTGKRVVDNVDKVVDNVPKKKIRTTYRAGDLLDPITPEMQRLDRSLEMKENGGNNDAE